jgi:hypothetical protein
MLVLYSHASPIATEVSQSKLTLSIAQTTIMANASITTTRANVAEFTDLGIIFTIAITRCIVAKPVVTIIVRYAVWHFGTVVPVVNILTVANSSFGIADTRIHATIFSAVERVFAECAISRCVPTLTDTRSDIASGLGKTILIAAAQEDILCGIHKTAELTIKWRFACAFRIPRCECSAVFATKNTWVGPLLAGITENHWIFRAQTVASFFVTCSTISTNAPFFRAKIDAIANRSKEGRVASAETRYFVTDSISITRPNLLVTRKPFFTSSACKFRLAITNTRCGIARATVTFAVATMISSAHGTKQPSINR